MHVLRVQHRVCHIIGINFGSLTGLMCLPVGISRRQAHSPGGIYPVHRIFWILKKAEPMSLTQPENHSTALVPPWHHGNLSHQLSKIQVVTYGEQGARWGWGGHKQDLVHPPGHLVAHTNKCSTQSHGVEMRASFAWRSQERFCGRSHI